MKLCRENQLYLNFQISNCVVQKDKLNKTKIKSNDKKALRF
jgi:hypothetical protein